MRPENLTRDPDHKDFVDTGKTLAFTLSGRGSRRGS